VSDPYCYPGTEVLRNVLDISDATELQRVEFEHSFVRLIELAARPLPGRYDLEHLQAFHRHIFQDVYPWAGELRTVDIAKGGEHFARAQYIRGGAANVFEVLAARNYLRDLGHRDFVARAAELLGDVNALHPFREGNGRAQRAYLTQLARDAGWNIDWRHVTADQNLEASIASLAGDNVPFEQLLAVAVTAHQPGVQQHPSSPVLGVHEQHQLHQELYGPGGTTPPSEGPAAPQP
jgi:cell filamentation protein